MGCAVSHQAADNLVLKDKYPVVGSDLIMCQKAHGTSDVPVQSPLRWGCSVEEADRICNFNRHYAEASGRSLLSICPFFSFPVFQTNNAHSSDARTTISTSHVLHTGSAQRNKHYKSENTKAKHAGELIKFYDSNTGNSLFEAPRGRTHDDFWKESNLHGWPSFRDEEVNWEFVRCLKNGECVSIHGTHLVSGSK